MPNGEVRAQGGAAAARTVREAGEFSVIDRVVQGRRQTATTVVGPGDDASVLSAAGMIAASTDMLVEGQHFRLDWSSPRQVGRKAIAQNAADIVSMGAAPISFLVALGCPPDTPLELVDELTDGLWEEAGVVGADISGGDLVRSEQIVVSVAALGDLHGRPAVLRSGARPGDVVAVAGELGRSAAGFALLRAGLDGPAELIDVHRVPRPPYQSGIAAALADATAMTDISDGLVADLRHIAAASGVRIVVDRAALAVAEPLALAARACGADAMDWVLSGGEDHALAATFPGSAPLPDGWRTVGAVQAGSPPAVLLDGAEITGAGGWRSWA